MPRGDSRDTDPAGGKATLGQFYRSVENNVMLKLRVAMPAEVLAYSPPVPGLAPALVRIRPHFVSARVIDNPTELRPQQGETLLRQGGNLLAVKTLPDVPNRPVHYPGHAGMCVRGPIDVGEVGTYLVFDRSIDGWINEGGPLDQSTHETHDLTHGVFMPGLRSGNVAQAISPTDDSIGREDGTAGLSIGKGPEGVAGDITVQTTGPNATLDAAALIKLGAAAVEAIAKADTLISVLDGVFSAGAAAGVGAPGTTGKLAFDAAVIQWNIVKNSLKATKGRVE